MKFLVEGFEFESFKQAKAFEEFLEKTEGKLVFIKTKEGEMLQLLLIFEKGKDSSMLSEAVVTKVLGVKESFNNNLEKETHWVITQEWELDRFMLYHMVTGTLGSILVHQHCELDCGNYGNVFLKDAKVEKEHTCSCKGNNKEHTCSCKSNKEHTCRGNCSCKGKGVEESLLELSLIEQVVEGILTEKLLNIWLVQEKVELFTS